MPPEESDVGTVSESSDPEEEPEESESPEDEEDGPGPPDEDEDESCPSEEAPWTDVDAAVSTEVDMPSSSSGP